MNTVSDLEMVNGFAVDLGGTKLAVARIENGIIAERVQSLTIGDASADKQIASIEILLRKVGWNNVQPVCVAVAGRVCDQGIWSAVNTGTLTSIQDVRIKAQLSQHLNTEVYVCNDAQAAAFAEANFGGGIGATHFAYITVSTGVGGGIVIAGTPVSSPNGLAGHIGFVSSRFSTTACGSGRHATVESVAGGKAIARIATEQGHPVGNARDVFAAATKGDEWASKIIQTSAQAVATLCADLTAILGLEKIALGGSIGLASGYLTLVQQQLEHEPVLFRPKIAPAKLCHDSALIGAIALSKSNASCAKSDCTS